jgi:tetratricopeptide (TPR) repeat protein
MDTFISYASEQRALAEEIALALREEGHRVFFDRSALPEGEAYNARIREAIRGSDLLIFLLSPQAVSQGRYTMTELKFAEEKWSSPTGHVLPVMVSATDMSALPAYLRAVVILRPAGSVAAEVVAAVERLSQPRWKRRIRPYAAALLVLILVGGGFGAWRAVESRRICNQALPLIASAKLQHTSGDYAVAWDGYAKALAICPDNTDAGHQQQRLAMDWLDNIRVTSGKETFTDIVKRVEPVLSRAAVDKDDVLAADALAHLGWGDFLRSRDGQTGLDPVRYYQQALNRDPRNAYAHAFWGHYLLVKGEDLNQAKAHFDQALSTISTRAFVRGIEVSARSCGAAASSSKTKSYALPMTCVYTRKRCLQSPDNRSPLASGICTTIGSCAQTIEIASSRYCGRRTTWRASNGCFAIMRIRSPTRLRTCSCWRSYRSAAARTRRLWQIIGRSRPSSLRRVREAAAWSRRYSARFAACKAGSGIL